MAQGQKQTVSIDDALNHIWKEWIRRASEVWSQQEPAHGVPWQEMLRDRTDSEKGAIPNSLQSAEALLCFLLPHWSISDFSLSDPARPSANVATKLRVFGGESSNVKSVLDHSRLSRESQLRILSLAHWYLEAYCVSDGERLIHDFSVGSYLTPDPDAPDPEALQDSIDAIEVTDSYTFSVTLCLIVKHLARQWSVGHPEKEFRALCSQVADLASDRLTSALLGLCDSFCVTRFDIEKWTDETRTEWPEHELELLRARLNALLGESGQEQIGSDEAFECGWTWGRIQNPLRIVGGDQLREDRFRPLSYPAQPAPYFYFTLCAVDGIVDLFSPAVETTELLTAEQLLLASRLKQLWDISSHYWAEVARSSRIVYGRAVTRRWSVQVPPWSASDGDASDYGSVSLAGILIRAMADRRISWGRQEVVRLTDLLEELTQRAQINREPGDSSDGGSAHELDQSVNDLVVRGRQNRLIGVDASGSEVPLFMWTVLDYVPQLLKRVAQLMAIAPDSDIRRRLEYLAAEIWELHIVDRMLWDDPDFPKLWDDPRRIGPVRSRKAKIDQNRVGLSWYMTERMTEAAIAYRIAQNPAPVDPTRIVEFIEVVRNRARYELAEESYRYADELRILDEAQGGALSAPLRSLASVVQALSSIWTADTTDQVTKEMS